MRLLACLSLLYSLSMPLYAADYQPSDLLTAWRRGLPDATLQSIASKAREATAVEKGCLVAAGVPAEVVSRMRGPSPTNWVEELRPECVKLGLDAPAMEADDLAARAAATMAATMAFETREAARLKADAARAWPECIAPDAERKGDKPSSVAEAVELWMGEQLAAGRGQFLAFTIQSTMTYQGSGGGTSDAVVCAW